ncbi:MAG: FKBP-type peptidyl-prolyl cis-trans isomerase [Candidatus Bathyarchaeota archaeon]|jgi:peptidylprolyl isomerase
MVLKKGDFIIIDYVGTIKETSKVFDTTSYDLAKKENLYKEGEIYEPKLVVIGEGWVLKALDENLTKLKINKKEKIEIPQEKAFGVRDPEKVRRVSLKQLTSKGITPNLGMRIEYNGKMATVRTIGAGRVLLDFNQPLAGKTLVYEVTLTKELKLKDDKILALTHRRIPSVEASKFKLTIKTKTVQIKMPEETFYIEGIQLAKRGIAMDIQRFFPLVKTVSFVEAFKTKPKTQTKT